MIQVKTAEEIELMRESALIVSKTLGMLAREIKPGVTGLHLDRLAEAFIRDHGAEPGFLGMYDFPNTLNISPNAQVVHGIPSDAPFEEGDIISVDCGSLKNGYYGDHAYTFEVGEVVPETLFGTADPAPLSANEAGGFDGYKPLESLPAQSSFIFRL